MRAVGRVWASSPGPRLAQRAVACASRRGKKGNQRSPFDSHTSREYNSYGDSSSSHRKGPFSWLRKLLAFAPVVLLKDDDEEGNPRKFYGASLAGGRVPVAPVPDHVKPFLETPKAAPEEPPQRRVFTGTGRLMLGLGTLGVLAYTHPGQKGEKDVLRVLDALKSNIQAKASSPPEEQLPIKRTLFNNIQQMFNLQPAAPVEVAQPPNPAPVKPPAKQDTEKHVFEHLVVGDKLVLTERDITTNQWKALSTFLSSCPHIKSLRLQGMEITADDADELGKGLNQIRHITFCDNSIGLNDGALERLVALLLCCGLLESTSIIRNSLGDEHVSSIATLMKHPRMERLSLCWNGLTDTGATQLANAVVNLNGSLRDVDLSYNLIGHEGRSQLQLACSRRRLDQFRPITFQLRHNERFRDFKRDVYKEKPVGMQELDPPWYLRRSIFGSKDKTPKPPWKRSKK